MTDTPRYCIEADLLVGDIPLPAPTTAVKYIAAAENEIDSYLGGIYVTPIDLTPDPTAPEKKHHSMLVLKRMSSQLASGRLITAVSTGGEDGQVHQYGKMLIDEVLLALRQFRSGAMTLSGIDIINTDSENTADQRGAIYNVDEYSQVEGFQSQVAPGGFMNTPTNRTYYPNVFGH